MVRYTQYLDLYTQLELGFTLQSSVIELDSSVVTDVFCTFGNRPGLCHQGDEVLGEFDDFSWQSAGDGSRGKFGL